ncbi:alpha/beta hydrolase [Streptomyces cynarae]|uniref:alpha/beta hydrolase n=1 Tax=Streptomyces cynarae TaxID=2981134 RepID=UPI0028BD2B69|nr:alpha/beta hydrolase [Streptomyces cynarae]
MGAGCQCNTSGGSVALREAAGPGWADGVADAAFAPPPLDGLTPPGPTRLVAGDDDPYCPEVARTGFGDPLGIPPELIPGAAHFDLYAGYGPWPVALEWCLDGSARLTAHPAQFNRAAYGPRS